MGRSPAYPDLLFDRPWRPGHPFRPRIGRIRRWGMRVLFLLLCGVIGGYLILTDAQRVRAMAESYLSRLVGGPVTVGDARLSVFEGLRLDDVRVNVDAGGGPDALLFTADTFLIKYNPRSMLKGRLDATQIVAINPRVYLTENLESGRWNYQRLARIQRPDAPTGPGMPTAPPVPPEVLLRNAQLVYSEVGGGQLTQRGFLDIDGRLWQNAGSGRYSFELQSRGALEGVGPVVSGSVALATGQFTMRLQKFHFGPDIRSLLMAPVRGFWEEHQLQGRLDIPEFTFTPGHDGKPASFRMETELDGVTLVVHPEEFNSREENLRLARVRDALELMGRAHLNGGGLIGPLNRMFHPPPIRLERVAGTFVFTENGVSIERASGRIETNAFRVSGRLEGYSSDAAAYLRVETPPTENIYIPHAPRYIDSLPPPVREVYDRFRPEGTARAEFQWTRSSPGARPRMSGEIQIIDGSFTFDHFPYPVRNATGRIVLGTDPGTHQERLEIKELRGLGAAGTPNADSSIRVNGHISPLGPTAGVNVTVSGEKISSDPLLRAAFPSETREALALLDSEGKGDFPRFKGGFSCQVIRPVGYRTHWIINTDIRLDDASGALVAFPYPLEGVTALLKVREGYVQIVDATTRQGDATLRIDGRVNFGRNRPVTPDLTIRARNVPIDRKLLDALPPERRAWLAKIGLVGKLDIDGRIYGQVAAPATAPAGRGTTRPAEDVNIDLVLKLRDGSLWPVQDTFAISDLSGEMRLSSGRLLITDLSGRRGEATVSARGSIAWDQRHPRAVLSATATNLLLDQALYGLLPAAAQSGWRQMAPQGTVDARIDYSGALDGPGTAPADAPSAGAAPTGFELTLTPRSLAVTPEVFPYKLESLGGTVSVWADKVRIKDMTATHGEGRIRIDGEGTLGETNVWDLQLRATNVAVDEQLRAALPIALAGVLDGIALQGTIDASFSKLRAVTEAESGPSTMPTTDGTTRPTAPARLDWSATIAAHGASLKVGVPLDAVSGTIELAGTARDGKLSELHGTLDLPTLKIAGRDASNLKATLSKPADQPTLALDNMQASLCGGDMAGKVHLSFPDEGASAYELSLLLRDASVRELAGQFEPDLQGRLTASLAMQGDWNDPSSRRGRGDVLATGKNMYRIPVLLGLLEIANLSLPINSPFTEASARYMVRGPLVTFEQIRLRSANMLMDGTGVLDFQSKRVRLTFTTENPNWPKLPFIDDLIQGARNQLLQIHVRGSIEEPKVSASSMNTVTTTVDEVFRDDRR